MVAENSDLRLKIHQNSKLYALTLRFDLELAGQHRSATVKEKVMGEFHHLDRSLCACQRYFASNDRYLSILGSAINHGDLNDSSPVDPHVSMATNIFYTDL